MQKEQKTDERSLFLKWSAQFWPFVNNESKSVVNEKKKIIERGNALLDN